jgi:hypothetical protein
MPLGQHTRHVVVGAPNYFANRSRPIAPADLIGPRWLPPFSLRTSQRNRNELGETTVNKTWRKIPAAAIKINNLELKSDEFSALLIDASGLQPIAQ